jgi:GNAT superfamily N-acetyltransferase
LLPRANAPNLLGELRPETGPRRIGQTRIYSRSHSRIDDEVEQVYVAAPHRGTGVAGVLMREAERQVRANGHSKGWLAVVAGNARARAFYERAGWHDEGPFE